ncbi:MAG: hypothetical protein IAE79_03235 [Anaerolinea sp.]|nr:hypothetical protein [Anaerolinea sp.]
MEDKKVTTLTNVLQVCRDALRLDLYDLSYMFNADNFRFTLLGAAALPRAGVLLRIGVFLLRWLQSLGQLQQIRHWSMVKNHPILFFAASQNQQKALESIVKATLNARFVGIKGFGDETFPMVIAYTISLLFFPHILWQYLKSVGDTRQSYRYFFDLYWLSCGYYMMARWVFRRVQPQGIVLANDHVMWTRALMVAARDEQVVSIYVQHASVTERFPPLSFDYALLEGVDALEKYNAAGQSDTAVFLIGIANFDGYATAVNRNPRVSAVGICTNLFETFAQVEQLGAHLQTRLPTLSFTLRSHPGDPRIAQWRALAYRLGWTFSDARAENIFVFLRHVDALIAGDSNVHLEAVLLNVVPLYYDFTAKKMDWYGFYRNGLVEYYNDPETLGEALQALHIYKQEVRYRARRYCATLNTMYDGRSTELAVSLIQTVTTTPRHCLDLTNWEPVAAVNGLHAYQLSCSDSDRQVVS